jgi:hypothetical protein
MFQMAEVTVSRQIFQEILMLIARLRAPPAPAWRRSGAGERGPTMGEVRLGEGRATQFRPCEVGAPMTWLPPNFVAANASVEEKLRPTSGQHYVVEQCRSYIDDLPHRLPQPRRRGHWLLLA